MNHRFLLVDCNNFYTSCEKVFRPDLEGKPVVVLSNNDGCIISSSKEVKPLGISRGESYFKVKHQLKKAGAIIFSSNYTLYGDMSARIMETIDSLSPSSEVYSIDETFVDFPNFKLEDGIKIKETVFRNTGVPVSVGAGTTKTLAKISSRIAKKYAKTGGVFDISSYDTIDEILDMVEVGDIWGVGRQSAKKLNFYGVITAKDFKYMDIVFVKKIMGVLGVRTCKELNGESCIELDALDCDRKSIVSSRSFGTRVSEKSELLEASSYHSEIIAGKLRAQNSCASAITISVQSHPFGDDKEIYRNSLTYKFDTATSTTVELIKASQMLLERLYVKGPTYKKVGVVVFDLVKEGSVQLNLFKNTQISAEHEKVDGIIDSLNRKWGKGTLSYAASGIEKKWSMKRDMLSPEYTTNWDDIPKVKA